ncbi:MAG: hypothetical protein QOD58_2823 [Mycobacterium sp.]|jgi:hypothetical protein|nr:hypothetical protein [Mycobacterium sp.]
MGTTVAIDDALLAKAAELTGVTEIGSHHLVIEELAIGSIKQREVVLAMPSNLHKFPTVTPVEILHLARSSGPGTSA